MAEYAGKGVAGTGLGLGIAGTALALLNNGGNGLLGGLFGNNNMGVSALLADKDAKIASLEAEKYSDSKDIQLYEQVQKELEKQQEKTITYVQMEMQKNQEIGELREKLVRAELGGQIAQVASNTANGFAQANAAIAALQNTVNGITQTVIPKDAICPEVMERFNSWVAPTATASA